MNKKKKITIDNIIKLRIRKSKIKSTYLKIDFREIILYTLNLKEKDKFFSLLENSSTIIIRFFCSINLL